MAARYIGLDKLKIALRDYRNSGGLRASLYKLYRMSTLKTGRLVGQDKYGNKYFEDSTQFFGRNRWVEFAEYRGESYDASQIPAEWYGWMHNRTDLLPMQDPSRPKHPWMLDHSENLSGTKCAYMPYSTTKQKIEAWDPKASQGKKDCACSN
ncbi:probable NADH dehydrogenase [ubiquinone] 1 alpha subcomplex subunit 12 [Topomyia yanbarensis]|uniref:probable NADH dehydrogenase [ubiquinone] 1 alpha subcomplex subunit 12 n=1 Tax=Topomyia yanbarensis TaxID=2498891 RepID=UPI00273B99D7|nr:probable NADH dehydrogenase [ubiquinone] 1 alpha subcomplex subunit 12 [Topomyia yanbarensis]